MYINYIYYILYKYVVPARSISGQCLEICGIRWMKEPLLTPLSASLQEALPMCTP